MVCGVVSHRLFRLHRSRHIRHSIFWESVGIYRYASNFEIYFKGIVTDARVSPCVRLPCICIYSVSVLCAALRCLPLTLIDPRAHYPMTHSPKRDKSDVSENLGRTTTNPYGRFSVLDAVPAPFDIPPALVNRVLYGKRSKRVSELVGVDTPA